MVKSESAGLVQARSTMVLPGVAEEKVTAEGEALSTVMVALPESVPAVVLVAVIAVTVVEMA